MVKTAGETKRWNADRKLSAAAVFISFCALALSLYGGYESRRHDRLAVKPLMTIDFAYRDEGAGFIMVNDGLGPAIIRSFEVFVDGKPQMTWHAAAKSLGLSAPTFWMVPSASTVWKASDDTRTKIFWIDKGESVGLLKSGAPRVEINVCYCSIYDECWIRTRHADLPRETSCIESKNQLIDELNRSK